jgi:hypothetical protein
MMKIKVLVPVMIIVGLLAGFGGGYFFRSYQLTKSRGNFAAGVSGTQRFVAGRNGGGQNGGGMMRNGVFGSILSTDANSITVKLPDGSTKIVILGASTTYSNTIAANQSDLKSGVNVAVVGTTNSDGSVTATNVQINPEFGRPQASAAPAK